MLGFAHTQKRRDRDHYVKILWDNIEDDYRARYQFETCKTCDLLGLPYDFNSIMHYNEYAFSVEVYKKKTIVALNGEEIKRGNGFSPLDIKGINQYYECEGNSTLRKMCT